MVEWTLSVGLVYNYQYMCRYPKDITKHRGRQSAKERHNKIGCISYIHEAHLCYRQTLNRTLHKSKSNKKNQSCTHSACCSCTVIMFGSMTSVFGSTWFTKYFRFLRKKSYKLPNSQNSVITSNSPIGVQLLATIRFKTMSENTYDFLYSLAPLQGCSQRSNACPNGSWSLVQR